MARSCKRQPGRKDAPASETVGRVALQHCARALSKESQSFPSLEAEACEEACEMTMTTGRGEMHCQRNKAALKPDVISKRSNVQTKPQN